MGQSFIGIRTSIPQLTISVAAIARSQGGMSVGNIVGNNILDTLLPIGLAAMIAPVIFAPELLTVNLTALFGLSLLVVLFFLRRESLRRHGSGALIALYSVYVLTKFISASLAEFVKRAANRKAHCDQQRKYDYGFYSVVDQASFGYR